MFQVIFNEISAAEMAALPKDLQLIVEIACQAEYDQVASDFYAKDPAALKTLVDRHGVQVRQFPEEILKAGAEASLAVLNDVRASDDPLTKKAAESFVAALNTLRTRTELVDSPYLRAREKYFKI